MGKPKVRVTTDANRIWLFENNILFMSSIENVNLNLFFLMWCKCQCTGDECGLTTIVKPISDKLWLMRQEMQILRVTWMVTPTHEVGSDILQQNIRPYNLHTDKRSPCVDTGKIKKNVLKLIGVMINTK